jgi:hypothetical protein
MNHALGYGAIIGGIPLLLFAIYALAGRDYVGGGLLIFAFAALSHLGVELLALATVDPTTPDGDGP